MHALPAAPAPAPRRQLFVGTALLCAGLATMYGGMLALYIRFRQSTINSGGVWRPEDAVIPEVPTNIMLMSFLGIYVFAQWAVYAARRQHTTYTALALGLVALVGFAVINAQVFVYSQMELAIADGTYQMFFYTLTGLFVVLMIAGVFFTLVTAFRHLGGRTREREIVSAHAMYWYFLGAAYAALWFVVYVTK
jgi:heme/copper-type cytochrome/quinol oxidase subunit 3